MVHKTTPRRAFAASALMMAFVLAACGTDGDADSTPTPDNTADAAPAETEDDSAADAPESLVLGLVPSQEIDQLVLDADALAELLSAELDIPVEALVTDSGYSALVIAMQTGQADIGMFGPIALVQSVDQAGAVPILQSVRYGASTYVTQWFTNDPDRFCETEVVYEEVEGQQFGFCNGTNETTDGPLGESSIALIEQDESIAFVDEASASGYYYPATQLEAAGLDPFNLGGAFFAGGHPNAVLSVFNGDATVGTSFNDARVNVVEEQPTIGEEVIVFAYSPNIPNDGVSVSGSLSPEWQERIKNAFMAVSETEEGAAALSAVYSIDALVEADLDALDVARQVEANFGE